MDDRERQIREFIDKYGLDASLRKLQELETSEEGDELTLTIISNAGVHRAPPEILIGTIFEASRGNIDFSNKETIHREYEYILKKVASILKSRRWRTVYLVPFGHSTLSMQIKLLIYKIAGIETIEWFYNASTGYFQLKLSLRDIIISAGDGV